MTHQLTITVDEIAYKVLKPMVEQETINVLLNDFIQNHSQKQSSPSIAAMRGTLHQIDTSDLRDEIERLQ